MSAVSAGGTTYVVRGGGPGLSRAGRAIAGLMALILLLIAALVVMSAAGATVLGRAADPTVPGSIGADAEAVDGGRYSVAPGTGDTGQEPALEDAIAARWDGPTTHLDWRGSGYATAEAGFVAERIASPGDRVHRTLTVGNAGPADAVMAISLALAQQLPATSENPDLAQRVELFWDAAGVAGSASFADLLRRDGGRPVVAEVRVPRGAEVDITVGFAVPAEVETERASGGGETLLSFDVLVRMHGDVDAPAAGPDDSGPLARTGVSAVVLATLAVLGLLVVLVGLRLVCRRGRRCDACGARIRRDEPWVVLHRRDGARQVLCLECSPASARAAALEPAVTTTASGDAVRAAI
ncbi:hypothetical protein [Microbacterium sp. NPDC096154]|uniref:hypothetical protein n=1 Tax=Microbacterium sp. NPDC096154 TaxID=3155549 RepID=UPI0033292F04